MKIVSVETSIVALPFEMGAPHGSFAGKPWTRLEILLVKVTTDDGLVGWGESFGHAANPVTKAALDTIVAPLVIGKDASDIAALSEQVLRATHILGRNGPFVFAFSGIEIALWDIAGKRAGLPLYRLLGGAPCSDLPAYASLLRYGNVEAATRNTAAAVARGYRAVKLHENTREAVVAAKAVANGAELMTDVNCVWNVQDAQRMADIFAAEGLFWLEEPVWPPEDAAGLAQVRGRGVAIAAGENTAGYFGFKTLIDLGAIDIAQPSISKVGGVGEMKRIIELCKVRGIKIRPHSAYYGPGFLATVHVSAALVPDPLVEMFWLDMEANPFDPWVRAEGGRIAVPQAPGLGCEPDPEVLARYSVGAPVVTR